MKRKTTSSPVSQIDTFLTRLAARGTRLTLERARLQMHTVGVVAFDRLWICGPIYPGDWELLKRFKPQIVAVLKEREQIEMSVGDTHIVYGEPFAGAKATASSPVTPKSAGVYEPTPTVRNTGRVRKAVERMMVTPTKAKERHAKTIRR